jgi:hypothetical protein
MKNDTKRKDEIQVRIESTFPLQDHTPTATTPKPCFETPTENHHLLFKNILLCSVLARTVYIILAQQKHFSLKTFENFVVIYFPICISIQYSQQINHVKGFYGSILLYAHLILYFGLGWTISGTRNSQRDTLASFLFFVCFLRLYQSMTMLYKAYKKKIVDDTFINACVVLVPIIPWFACYFQTNGLNVYFWYIFGMGVDVASAVVGDCVSSRYNHRTFLLNETKMITKMLFAILCFFLYEIRVFAEYPENIVGIEMNVVNFLIGCVGLLCVYSMYIMYSLMMERAEKYRWNCWKGSVFKWCHFVIQGSLLISVAGIHMVSMNIYYPASITNGIPLNLSIPITDLFGINSLVDTNGINYLLTLKEFYISTNTPMIASSHVSLMVTGLGSFCFIIALMEWSLGTRDNVYKAVIAWMMIVGISGIITGTALRWETMLLPVPLIVVTTIITLLVLGKIFAKGAI